MNICSINPNKRGHVRVIKKQPLVNSAKLSLPLVIFAHIEKTGGTSLNGILRTYHGIRYAHVRALLQSGTPARRAVHVRDLKYYLQLAPWLRCVSGHAVRPWVLLNEGVKDGLFMSVLRESVSRYVSYYTYGGGVPKKPWPYSFEKYLDIDVFHNYQTKRIAGCADAEKAMMIIEQSFMAVATLDAMDTLINSLDSIWPGIARCATLVGRRNVRKDTVRQALIERHYDQIVENNTADIALYAMLKEKYNGLFLRQEIFDSNVEVLSKKYAGSRAIELAGILQERLYFKPITGMMRLAHGLPYKGTY